MFEIERIIDDVITCPYCKDTYEDSWEVEHDIDDEECPNCHQHFSIEIQRSVDYKCIPNCKLNVEEHDWIDMPADAVKCSKCGMVKLKSNLTETEHSSQEVK